MEPEPSMSLKKRLVCIVMSACLLFSAGFAITGCSSSKSSSDDYYDKLKKNSQEETKRYYDSYKKHS